MSTRDLVAEAYVRLDGNISACAREIGVTRATIRYHLQKLDTSVLGLEDEEEPRVDGNLDVLPVETRSLPPKGEVKRYILTSAQNNTKLNDAVWTNLLALADFYPAELLVATYSYNLNAYGAHATKRGHEPEEKEALWYDERLSEYILQGDDKNIDLCPDLRWCGRANIIPTAARPLSGFENYAHTKSAIFPHAKFAMESIPNGKTEEAKINYTTGTVTQRNYVQRKAGLKAEHHHGYGGLLLEIDHTGQWFVRQLNADSKGRIYDLDLLADNGDVTTNHRVEAIGWGDIHYSKMDHVVNKAAWADGGMLDILKPKYQFMHDLIDFTARRHHDARNPHKLYEKYIDCQDDVEEEMRNAAGFLTRADRPWCETIVIESNHDNDFERWLRETDYRHDPANAEYFLEAQLAKYQSISGDDGSYYAIEWAMRRENCPTDVKFLRADDSFIICRGGHGGIECGMHGHLGANGSRGTPIGLSKGGRKANTAHTHSAAIIDGLYVGGVSAKLDQGYNRGPSSWSQSHVITYANGKRCIITMKKGAWRSDE